MDMNRLLFSGALWSWVTKFGNQGISFLVFLIVARLIGPEQYGLASLCFVIFSLGSIILNGLGDGIIAMQEKDDKNLSSLVWFIVGMAVLMSVVCFLLASPLAQLLSLPDLAGLLVWFSPVFLLFGAGVVPNKLIYANMEFRLFAIRGLIGSLCSAMVGVYMAYQGMGAYAIIGQQLTLYLVMSLIAWLVIDWRPQWIWSTDALRRLLPPGFKAMSTEGLEFVDQQFPRVLVGSMLGPVALGYFAFVARIKYAIQDIIINPPLIVVYPAIAKIKDDVNQQEIMIGNVLMAVCAIVFPFVALAVLLAPHYVPVFFGEKWKGATLLLQIFIAGCVLLPFSVMAREIFRAHNRLGSFIFVQACSLPVTLLSYVLLLPYGLTYVAVGLLLLALIVVPIQWFVLYKTLGVNLIKKMVVLAKPLVVTVFMVLVVAFLERFVMHDVYPLLKVFFSVCAGCAFYLLIFFVFFRKDVHALVDVIKARRAG